MDHRIKESAIRRILVLSPQLTAGYDPATRAKHQPFAIIIGGSVLDIQAG